ncbi:MAG: SGNH/GDSL hydrolase family protein [Oscillospiraceae bacterium]|nr:SGNH/GDSL hydrolase family protein [Oscillospiraceae bacterium]
MKKIISMMLFCSMLLMTACSGTAQEKTSQKVSETQAQTEVLTEIQTESETAPAEVQKNLFDDYVSNTVISTGNNYMTDAKGGVTFRTYFPVEESGELEYCFYFSNTVDSTWERGRYSYAGKSGGAYQILNAHVWTASSPDADDDSEPVEITFDGSPEKSVSPDETFRSDAVTLDVPEGKYLVWEWTLDGEDIPCIRMTELAYSYILKEDGILEYNMDVPAPQLIGTNRNVRKKIACFGDSITQGAETTAYEQNFWVSELSERLGSEYAVWNIGCGYARASDAVLCGNWLERAKNADIVTLAFGTNDLAVGQYGQRNASSADEIENWLRMLIEELQKADCQIILFNLPPFNFDESTETIRTEVNARIPVIAEETGCAFFDWAILLENPDNPAESLYGGHPDDEGCRIIADALLEQFSEIFEK